MDPSVKELRDLAADTRKLASRLATESQRIHLLIKAEKLERLAADQSSPNLPKATHLKPRSAEARRTPRGVSFGGDGLLSPDGKTGR